MPNMPADWWEKMNEVTRKEFERQIMTTPVVKPWRPTLPLVYRQRSWAERHPLPAALLCMLGALALGTAIAYLLVLEGIV